MGTLFSDVALQVLSFRDRERAYQHPPASSGGYHGGKGQGVRSGRPSRPLPENYHNAYQRRKARVNSGTAAVKERRMPLSMFQYRAKICEQAKLL